MAEKGTVGEEGTEPGSVEGVEPSEELLMRTGSISSGESSGDVSNAGLAGDSASASDGYAQMLVRPSPSPIPPCKFSGGTVRLHQIAEVLSKLRQVTHEAESSLSEA